MATTLPAQQSQQHLTGGNEGRRPIGWQVRYDKGEHAVHGNFVVESTMFLFPTKGRDREGYGIFVGGADLAGVGQRHTYFLLRNDGKFLVKQRGALSRERCGGREHAARSSGWPYRSGRGRPGQVGSF